MGRFRRATQRVDIQASLFSALAVLLSCLILYAVSYRLTYNSMIRSLEERVYAIANAVETVLDKDSFHMLNVREDMDTPLYRSVQDELYHIKMGTGVRYLYTATRNEAGVFIYQVDGLDLSAEDFRCPGDPIEVEIIPELELAMTDQAVLPHAIKDTEWGKIFIAYLPIHENDRVVGVLGVEFEAEDQFNTYRNLKLVTPIIILGTCLIASLAALWLFRRVSNPTFQDVSNSDHLTGLKNRNAFQTDMNNLSARRGGGDIQAVILLDLNDLKKINDTMGHDTGDRYLQLAAQAIRSAISKTDTAYRVGGDEFAILTPLRDGEAIARLIEDIRAQLDASRPDAWQGPFSLSAGWAVFDFETDADTSQAYRRADDVMYQDKQRYHNA